MNRFTRFTTTVFAAIACAGAGVLHADTPARPDGSKPAAAGPTVTPYATGLTNPRGLTFGPDGNLYVAEAGVGGGQTRQTSTQLPRHRQRLQPLLGRLQRPGHPRAGRRYDRDRGRRPAERDRQHPDQLRADRRGVHRRHALRADRTGRLHTRPAQRPARDPAGQSRRLHHQCSQPECLAGEKPAVLRQGRTETKPTRNQAACSIR